MGSPLSPIVANIYMESFEEQAIETATDKPTLWLRYVDDMYVHWDYGREALDKLIHLNSQRPNITFTMEIETDDKLPFLDVQTIRDNETQTLRTEVFRKPTHTDRYHHYRSYHHHSIKQGIIRTLTHRCHSICKDEVSRKAEQQHLNQVFKSNGYPTRFIDRANRSRQRPHGQQLSTRICIPYIKGVGEQIKKVCNKERILVTFLSHRTLRTIDDEGQTLTT